MLIAIEREKERFIDIWIYADKMQKEPPNLIFFIDIWIYAEKKQKEPPTSIFF